MPLPGFAPTRDVTPKQQHRHHLSEPVQVSRRPSSAILQLRPPLRRFRGISGGRKCKIASEGRALGALDSSSITPPLAMRDQGVWVCSGRSVGRKLLDQRRVNGRWGDCPDSGWWAPRLGRNRGRVRGVVHGRPRRTRRPPRRTPSGLGMRPGRGSLHHRAAGAGRPPGRPSEPPARRTYRATRSFFAASPIAAYPRQRGN